MTDEEINKMAGRLLDGALRQNVPATAEAMAELEQQHPDAAVKVMLAWCDTLIKLKNIERGAQISLSWYDPATGGELESTDIPTTDQWAGRVIAARAAMDWPMFQALMVAIPPEQQMHHVLHLLGVVSENLRTMLNEGSY